MRKLMFLAAILVYCQFANAVGVVISKYSTFFQPIRLKNSHYQVNIQDQTSAITVTETFYNTSTYSISPRLYFPLPRGASATQLRWFINGQWHTAVISGVPQTPPGGPHTFPDYFVVYISLMPIVFDFNDYLPGFSDMIVELTYVQLAPYTFGNINLILKNDYSLIQTQQLDYQSLDIVLESDRQIISFDLNVPGATITNNGYTATASSIVYNTPATANYSLMYSLQQTTLGLQFMSTLKDSIPDGYGNGFFSCIIETPSGIVTDSIPNKITLVIDHSGSMNYENKMVQAQNACNYIVDNLGANDRFNIIIFDHTIGSLWNSPLPNTQQNVVAAHTYINNISAVAPNGTNISDALYRAIQQYYHAPTTYNNIIILITDGQPTVGIVDTYQLVNAVDYQVSQMATNLKLFTFGIGSDVSYQLLTLLAEHNDGTAIFLGNNEIYSTITQFYDMIHQSALTNVNITTDPPGVFTEIYPAPMPNLYNTTQTVISGRYINPQNVQFQVTGMNGNTPQMYQIDAVLADETDSLLQFIPKIWASKKIDHLLVQYYSYPSGSYEAIQLRQQIINISISYGVVCVFSSFTGETPIDEDTAQTPTTDIVLLGNYPNPFNPETRIRFEVKKDIKAPAFVYIYNIKGQLVRTLATRINAKGLYEVLWDGKDDSGNSAASGTYFYKISIKDYVLTGKMTMLK
jgi:hypothetical protein